MAAKTPTANLERISTALAKRQFFLSFFLSLVTFLAATSWTIVYYHRSKTSDLIHPLAPEITRALEEGDGDGLKETMAPLLSSGALTYVQVVEDPSAEATPKRMLNIDRGHTLVVGATDFLINGNTYTVYTGYPIPHLHVALLFIIFLIYAFIVHSVTKRPFSSLEFEANRLKSLFRKLLSDAERANSLENQDKIIKQIVHDIKAPLAALKTISRQGETIENDILASSINRINHITTELFQRQTRPQKSTITHFELALMDVINEKSLSEAERIKIKTDFQRHQKLLHNN